MCAVLSASEPQNVRDKAVCAGYGTLPGQTAEQRHRWQNGRQGGRLIRTTPVVLHVMLQGHERQRSRTAKHSETRCTTRIAMTTCSRTGLTVLPVMTLTRDKTSTRQRQKRRDAETQIPDTANTEHNTTIESAGVNRCQPRALPVGRSMSPACSVGRRSVAGHLPDAARSMAC